MIMCPGFILSFSYQGVRYLDIEYKWSIFFKTKKFLRVSFKNQHQHNCFFIEIYTLFFITPCDLYFLSRLIHAYACIARPYVLVPLVYTYMDGFSRIVLVIQGKPAYKHIHRQATGGFLHNSSKHRDTFCLSQRNLLYKSFPYLIVF